ncbi:phage tail tape measure protein [Psychrobacillus sp. L3]|uniref:phage tail tape measure protein n=1 Tax=Psychrobacillus sp. L3 TaxID=3236891 RepID=UPI0036F21F20
MSQQYSIVANIVAKTDQFVNAMNDASNKSNELAKNFADKTKAIGDGFTKVGKSLTAKVTLPLAAVGALAVKSSMDFESAFAGVRKTVDATEEEFTALSDGIRNMAKEIPAAATEIAGVAEAAGQLGIKKEAILGFTRTMVDLGVATNMSSEEAATALARLANITGMNQADFDKLGSSVVALGNNFATTEGEIVAMALRLSGAGSQIGMSEADILGLSAALSSVGIEAEMGGSALSKAMIRMQVAATTGYSKMNELTDKTGYSIRELQLMASNTPKAFTLLAESLSMTKLELTSMIKAGADLESFSKIAGTTSDQFVKMFQDDAVGALGAFINGLGNAEAAGDTAINMLEEMGISEVRLRDSLLRAGNASELFSDAIDLSNNAWKENVALTNEAEERYKTTTSQFTIFLNLLKDLGITIGGIIVPLLVKMMESLKPVIEKFANMSETTQRTIIIFGGIVAAIGPLLLIFGTLISSISSISSIVSFFGVLSGALAAAGGASAVFGGALALLTGPIGPVNNIRYYSIDCWYCCIG